MLFNPEESVDFNGNTGPFIQYAYARIQSLLKRAEGTDFNFSENITLSENEKELIIGSERIQGNCKQSGGWHSALLIWLIMFMKW